ncbi:hypothetical protein EV702DRAFT_731823 [Suillus placidus]|uniref:Uncharacterized protein n=1 Tax=Suillus placidus TaxID=48579 RepID=A0A9P7D6C8_9AGAM|nr:hypothetical protein EV702DRAFT_731823 [Suillus placidus]
MFCLRAHVSLIICVGVRHEFATSGCSESAYVWQRDTWRCTRRVHRMTFLHCLHVLFNGIFAETHVLQYDSSNRCLVPSTKFCHNRPLCLHGMDMLTLF